MNWERIDLECRAFDNFKKLHPDLNGDDVWKAIWKIPSKELEKIELMNLESNSLR